MRAPAQTAMLSALAAAVCFAAYVPGAAAEEFDLDELRQAEEEGEFTQTKTCQTTGNQQCDQGEQPLPVQWYHSPVNYQINVFGSQQLHPDEELTDDLKHAVFDSFDAWNAPECSGLGLEYDGTTDVDEPGYERGVPPEDNVNVLVWHDEDWPHPGYDAIALTSVSFRSATGEILSADIEFNTANYPYSDTDEPGETEIDFRNALTHEAGHFLGLEHSPNSDATMWRSTNLGETKKRTLHDADVAGICYIYPDGDMLEEPLYEQVDDDDDSDGNDSLCTAIPGEPSEPPVAPLLLVAVGLIVYRRVA